jgi:hypothetical protein
MTALGSVKFVTKVKVNMGGAIVVMGDLHKDKYMACAH